MQNNFHLTDNGQEPLFYNYQKDLNIPTQAPKPMTAPTDLESPTDIDVDSNSSVTRTGRIDQPRPYSRPPAPTIDDADIEAPVVDEYNTGIWGSDEGDYSDTIPRSDRADVDPAPSSEVVGAGPSQAPPPPVRPIPALQDDTGNPPPQLTTTDAPRTLVRRRCELHDNGFARHGGVLAGGDQAIEAGCNQNHPEITFGLNLNTADTFILSKTFQDFFNKNALTCVNRGLLRSGIKGKAVAVHFEVASAYRHSRLYSTRSKKWRLSFHGTGRSIDLRALKMYLDNGSERNYSLNVENRDKNFYNDFNNCWREFIYQSCDQKRGWASENKRSLKGASYGLIDAHHNKAHHDHVHMSLPFCHRTIQGQFDGETLDYATY